MVRGLVEEGADLRADHRVWHYREAVTAAEREALADLMRPSPPPSRRRSSTDPGGCSTPTPTGRCASAAPRSPRSTVPADWVVRANQLDEVWTSNWTEAEALVAAGVARERVAVVPEALELDLLDPATAPLAVPGAHGTVLLAVLEWGARAPSGSSGRGARPSPPPTT